MVFSEYSKNKENAKNASLNEYRPEIFSLDSPLKTLTQGLKSFGDTFY